ncbi:MAG: DUF177 domain-containing protein [Rhodospirillales bacterium]|nr:DUF177 domain-containing protein [Rhodospirillales bacterium]
MQEELSYPVKAAQIKDNSQIFTVSANEAQRAALAARCAIPGISRLEGRFTLHHERSGILAATLIMNASVIQICVVTLEPFEVTIQDTAALRFVPEAAMRHAPADDALDEDITPDALDSPDEIPYTNDIVDLGAALAEQLALILDPYPRKPSAALPDTATDGNANPFAALAARFNKPGAA